MSKEETKTKITKQSLRSLLSIFSYIKPYSAYFYGALVLLVVGSLLMMVIMGVPGEMVNVAMGEDSKFNFSLSTWGWVMFGALGLRALLSFIQTILFANVSERGMADIRKALYAKLITQDLGFFESNRIGELTSRITADVEKLQSVFSVTLAEFIRQMLILLFGIAVLAYLMPRLFLIMLSIIPVVVIMAMVFGRYIKKVSRKRQDQLAQTNTIVEETFQNFSVVKSFANEYFESMRYGNSIDKVIDISLHYARLRGSFFAFIIFLLFGSILFILWRGAYMVQRGEMEAGNLLSFVIYTVMIGGAIASLGSLYTTIASALGATERVKDILKRDSELQIAQHITPLELRGDVSFNRVSFSYPSRKDIGILSALTLDIKAGQKIALVGASGSGKSTLIKLLMNFYPLESGDILIDGQSINDYNISALRKSIGVVHQEVILFGGTIRENLLYGKADATDAELIEAAQKANCWEFIEQFPQGLDTLVGERGVQLSGGQRQRVAIARTILKDPSILLLDEATSALDATSERVVQQALDNLMEGRTAIIVAHRLATVRDVDCIYVMQNGQIIEQGTHEQLLNVSGGKYRELAQLQFDLA